MARRKHVEPPAPKEPLSTEALAKALDDLCMASRAFLRAPTARYEEALRRQLDASERLLTGEDD